MISYLFYYVISYLFYHDDNDKLHLIQINRGPDLHGLVRTLGERKVTNIYFRII